MKADTNTPMADEQEHSAVADPFAVDLFGGEPGPSVGDVGEGTQLHAAKADAPSWDTALPKVTREEARLSAALAATPAGLSAAASAALARVAGRLTNISTEMVSFEVLETREEDLSAFGARASSPRSYVRAAIEPSEAPVALVVESAFATALVDLMLGGEGSAADAPRALSTAERAVLEFFCAQLLNALNAEADEPLFRLESLTEEAGAFGAGRGLVTTLRGRVGAAAGVARLVYGQDALNALDELRSPILRRPVVGGARVKLARYATLCPGAEFALLVGETEVDPASLAGLEPGDVVVVERVYGEWGGGGARGSLRARVGAGDTILVGGAARRPAGVEGVGAGELRLLVEEVRVSEARAAEDSGRLWMEEESELDEGSGGEEAGLLDNLLLTVRVELPARRMSLDELTRLRAGQILELGCRATDPVELVADGRRVATGELVDIEGVLGVRVTRLVG